MNNPYNWRGHHPKHTVTRPQLEDAKEILFNGGGAYLLAGRGMGKSVFLLMLEQGLASRENLAVLRIPSPPTNLTAFTLLNLLAEKLDLTANNFHTSQSIFEAYFDKHPNTDMVVLLFDEFDRYAVNPTPSEQHHPGQAFFNDLESARKELDGRLGILVAGGIGTFVFRDVLGSSFLSRAECLVLETLTTEESQALCEPFRRADRPLEDDVFQTLYLASGGCPALLTYGLQQLWEQDRPTPRHVSETFVNFRVKHGEFINSVIRSISHENFSMVPRLVWQYIRQTAGPLSRASLQQINVPPEEDQLRIGLEDTLTLLQAAGLIKVTGSVIADDPLLVRPVTSILNLPIVSAEAAGVAERIHQDLLTLLSQMHQLSVDFFRPAEKGNKTLVPENTLSAFLALGLRMLGWVAEREAQSVAGRTDILLSRPGTSGRIVIEAKIWPRNDYKEIHRQVESYWSSGTIAGIAVMFTDTTVGHKKYKDECLHSVEKEIFEEGPFPLQGCWKTSSSTGHEITHYLPKLPRK